MGATASQMRAFAARAGTIGGFERRWEDWKLQERLARKEMDQIDTQILAAEIRLQITEKELENHETQIDHAVEIKEFMEEKFTNKELYQWMITQLGNTYRDVYKMAFDVAKIAEKTYQFELGIEETDFIKFGYMDSLRKGLLTGESLIADIKRMEISYLEKNKREFEITKPISLKEINADALQDLRKEGYCNFELPEVLFDLDFPGQYFRRIKTVRITIPCVTGPNVSVNAKLSLLSSCIRKSNDAGSTYAYSDINDPRFVHDPVGIQSIATSTAQNDSGLFELNFRDDRYLPFEGAGAVSRWRLDLPNLSDVGGASGSIRQFDYSTISDVIMNLSYTARDGGGPLKTAACQELVDALNTIKEIAVGEASDPGLVRVFSLKKEFPDVLHRLLTHPTTEDDPGADFSFDARHFPFILQDGYQIEGLIDDFVTLVVQKQNVADSGSVFIGFQPDDPLAPPILNEIPLTSGVEYSDGSDFDVASLPGINGWSADWKMHQTDASASLVKDILVVLRYRVAAA